MNTASYWNKKHTQYTGVDWIEKPSLFAQWLKQYLPQSGRLLDLGAGQGQDSRYFASLGYKVTSVDYSDEALSISRRTAANQNLDINFLKADLSQPLPFKNGSFDIIYAHLSLHYFDHQTTQRLFADIYRMLKPSGILAAIVNSTADPELAEGAQLESDFVEIESIQKRFFTPQTLEGYAKGFTTIIADQEGTSYKDPIKLVRYVGRKIPDSIVQ
jgi:SAM-dependent methyltransferase